MLGGQSPRRACRQDHVHFETEQLGGELGETLVLSLCPAELDENVLSLGVAEITETLAERLDAIAFERRGRVPQVTDPWDLPRLLRAGGERRREDAESK